MIWIEPLPDDARPAYNLLRSLVNRGLPFEELDAAVEHLRRERQAERVEARLLALLPADVRKMPADEET